MSKLAIMDYVEYIDLCDSIRAKAGTTEPLTASQAKTAIDGIEIINDGLLDGSAKRIVIPKEVRRLKEYCFANMENLEEVIMHDDIEEIGEYAFSRNNFSKGHFKETFLPSNLKKLSSIEVVGSSESAFERQNIKEEDNFYIGSCVYWNNADKTQRALVNGFFSRVPGADFFIPLDKVTHIAGSIAHLLEQGEDISITIPAAVKSLMEAYLVDGARDRVKSIVFEKNNSKLEFVDLQCINPFKNLEEIYIPQGQVVCEMPPAPPNHSSEMPFTLSLGQDVIKITGSNCLFGYECSELAIKFEDGETPLEIGDWTFGHCSSLKTLALPSRLAKLGQYAFNSCGSLQTVYFNSKPNEGESWNQWFDYCNALTDIYVPWAEGEVPGAPWGASNATVHYNYTPEGE